MSNISLSWVDKMIITAYCVVAVIVETQLIYVYQVTKKNTHNFTKFVLIFNACLTFLALSSLLFIILSKNESGFYALGVCYFLYDLNQVFILRFKKVQVQLKSKKELTKKVISDIQREKYASRIFIVSIFMSWSLYGLSAVLTKTYVRLVFLCYESIQFTWLAIYLSRMLIRYKDIFNLQQEEKFPLKRALFMVNMISLTKIGV